MRSWTSERYPDRLAEDELGADLRALVDDIGTPLLAAEPVTAVPSASTDRACFRLTFADGTVLKGRRVETVRDAERIVFLGSFLDTRVFPPVLARRGRAIVTSWVAGTPVSRREWTPALFRRCGRLQASLHAVVLGPADLSLRRRPAEWEPYLDGLLRGLAASEAIDVGTAGRIRALAARHAPHAPRQGLCHGDFCAENMIKTAPGPISVVDNDSLAVDAYEYDLARTWYRWPMESRAESAYAEGYGGSPWGQSFAEHFLHWALLVLVESSSFRIRARAPSAAVPLARLRVVLKREGRGDEFARRVGKG